MSSEAEHSRKALDCMYCLHVYSREVHTCEVIANHPQGEVCLSRTEPKSAELQQESIVIHA